MKKANCIELSEVSKILNLYKDDVVQFLVIRGYVYNHDGQWTGTAMGVEFGYIENKPEGVYITEKCLQKVINAFKTEPLTPDEQQKITDIFNSSEIILGGEG